jgi:hypothetical protein
MKHTYLNTRKMAASVNRPAIVLTVVGLSILSGCSRCQECTLNGATETICETEFDNSQQYEDAIADRESQGASCTSSGGF